MKTHFSVTPFVVFHAWSRGSCLPPFSAHAVFALAEKVMKENINTSLSLPVFVHQVHCWLAETSRYLVPTGFHQARVSAAEGWCALLLCISEYLSVFKPSCIPISLPALLLTSFSQTLARCIIMWDEILPNTEWVKSNIPQVRKYTYTQHYCSDIFCCCCDNILLWTCKEWNSVCMVELLICVWIWLNVATE